MEKLANTAEYLLGDKAKQLPDAVNNTSQLTTNTGAPLADNLHVMTVGARGPALMEDYHALEKLAQFDREKVPERVVHARGMTAKGYFEVTHDISNLTSAAFLSSVGKKTPVAARFSTVVHEKGSPESLRDVRGFSVKFYTEEGNWDFVGNNIPVFFIRDGLQFPDLVHCLRPNPRNHIQEGWRILDFLASHPESIHILTFLLDYPGIPLDWRHLEGFSVNTFKLVNKEGRESLVKFVWRPKLGAKFMTNEEAVQAGDLNMRHSHATHDLYNAIADGDYPEWELCVQTMDPAKQEDYDFDPLDCTKDWPDAQFPLQPVGKMVLNDNIINFHNESEQIAFSPGVVVPGIAFSDDKVLQMRVFSYSDTQRYRIGTQYQMLPINAPKCPYHNNHNDGAMNWAIKNEEVNYYPSFVEKREEHVAPEKQIWTKEHVGAVDGTAGDQRVKEDLPKRDEFTQPGIRYRTVIKPDPKRQAQFVTNVLGWLKDPKTTAELREIWLSYWQKVDESLAAELKEKLGAATHGKPGHPSKMGASKA